MNYTENIIKVLKELLTIQNISFTLGLIGSIGTLFNILNSRKRLIFSVSDSGFNPDFQKMLISVLFENRSRLPISITNVTISINDTEKNFEPYPRYVSEYSHFHGSNLVDRKFLYNADFPIALSQLGASSAHLLLDISQEDFQKLPTRMILKVYSTRGMVQKRILLKQDIRLIDKSGIQFHESEDYRRIN